MPVRKGVADVWCCNRITCDGGACDVAVQGGAVLRRGGYRLAVCVRPRRAGYRRHGQNNAGEIAGASGRRSWQPPCLPAECDRRGACWIRCHAFAWGRVLETAYRINDLGQVFDAPGGSRGCTSAHFPADAGVGTRGPPDANDKPRAGFSGAPAHPTRPRRAMPARSMSGVVRGVKSACVARKWRR
jgi:hypothetical protein